MQIAVLVPVVAALGFSLYGPMQSLWWLVAVTALASKPSLTLSGAFGPVAFMLAQEAKILLML